MYFTRTNLWHSLFVFPFTKIYFNDTEGSDMLKKLLEGNKYYLALKVEMYVENVLNVNVDNNL
jgi:hypothetical protein